MNAITSIWMYITYFQNLDMPKQDQTRDSVSSTEIVQEHMPPGLDWLYKAFQDNVCVLDACFCRSNVSNGRSGLSMCKESAELSAKKIKVVTPAASSKLWGVNILARAASVACLIMFACVARSHDGSLGSVGQMRHDRQTIFKAVKSTSTLRHQSYAIYAIILWSPRYPRCANTSVTTLESLR